VKDEPVLCKAPNYIDNNGDCCGPVPPCAPPPSPDCKAKELPADIKCPNSVCRDWDCDKCAGVECPLIRCAHGYKSVKDGVCFLFVFILHFFVIFFLSNIIYSAAIHVSKTSQSAHSRRTSIATATVVRRRRHVPHPAATARRNNSTPTRAVLARAVLNGIAQATAPLSFVRSFSVRKATNRSNKA